MKYLLSLIVGLVFSASAFSEELKLDIPKLNLSVPIGTSSYLSDLAVGGAHWSWTPLPGGFGNTVIGGHRTVRPGLFIDLDRLLAGDELIVTRDGKLLRYLVYQSFVLQRPHLPDIIDRVVDNRDDLTLVTCHPKYESNARLVIRARRQ
jgi:LPXTG-site transpeptidase (sortase) family protein